MTGQNPAQPPTTTLTCPDTEDQATMATTRSPQPASPSLAEWWTLLEEEEFRFSGPTRSASPLDSTVSDPPAPIANPCPLQCNEPALPASPPAKRRKTSPPPPPSVPRRPSVRINAASLFLTFPQCSTSKEEALRSLLAIKFPKKVLWAKICQEKHKDGSNHLHLLVTFDSKIDLRSFELLDQITGKRGNYQGARSVRQVSDYIHKEDPSPLIYEREPRSSRPTAPASRASPPLPPKEKLTDTVAKLVADGVTDLEISSLYPGFFMMNSKRIRDLRLAIATSLKPVRTPMAILPTAGKELSPSDAAIVQWCVSNLLNRARPLKTPQLYIWGPPNHNKTSFCHKLASSGLRMYPCPDATETFDHLWDDDLYDFSVSDEFGANNHRLLASLNKWLDGQHLIVRYKGGNALKKFNVPTIILSNYPPEAIFSGIDLESFLARLTVVELKTPIDMDILDFIYPEEEEPAPSTPPTPILPDASAQAPPPAMGDLFDQYLDALQ